MGKECEQIQITALSEYLQISIEIAYLDGRYVCIDYYFFIMTIFIIIIIITSSFDHLTTTHSIRLTLKDHDYYYHYYHLFTIIIILFIDLLMKMLDYQKSNSLQMTMVLIM